MRSNGVASLVAIVVLAVGLLSATILAGNTPLLGLDLSGGAEVVLEPVADTGISDENLDAALDQAASIIRSRVDSIGVAEPDITVQGRRIVVQLPGIDDQQRALELVGQTAELRFRPVIDLVSADLVDTTAREEDEAAVPEGGGQTGDESAYFGPFDCDPNPVPTADAPTRAELLEGELSDPLEHEACDFVILEGDVGGEPFHWLLGPTMLTGSSLEDAGTGFSGVEYVVNTTFQGGEEGIDKFNHAASACFNQVPDICPSGRLAIVLDGVVVSAPNVNAPRFDRDRVQISGGFNQREASDLATVLRYGALPVRFQDPAEAGFVRVVSATLGRDSLRAGVVAGIIGFSIAALYIMAYYRLLGVAAIASLLVSGSLLYTIVTFLSETRGLALTLAGVTGLIVSVGTSLDSNVVYFEHLKETVANGRTLRSAVDRSFPVAFRTIFWANLASLIGAVILYFLTEGSVRGFALMLGLASILDLVATYFFLRPAVRLMARSKRALARPGLLGIPPDLVARGQEVAAR